MPTSKIIINMRAILANTCTLILIANIVFAQKKNPEWVQEAKNANWQARDSQGEVVYKDQLWILGGWFNSYVAPPRDVWNSDNGKDWKLINRSAPWIHSDLAMSVVFKNKMWMMGGWYNGRLEGHSASNEIWSSEDGIKWKLETKAASWSPRVRMASIGQKYVMVHLGMSVYGSLRLFTVTGFGLWLAGQIIRTRIGRMCGIRKMVRIGHSLHLKWYGKNAMNLLHSFLRIKFG
jgi:hypothetical protein